MQFDTDSNINFMINKLRQKSSWADILAYSTNRRLIEVVGEMVAQFASYDEWLIRNHKWDQATEKSALVSQSQFMQYDAHRKIGATGTITLSSDENFNASNSKIIEVPKYTVFSNGDEIQFCSTQAESILTSQVSADIPVVQGEPKTFTYIAQGNNYEEVSIENDSIEDENYELYVNGELWSETEDLNSNDKDDKVYELEDTLNFDGINIIFGNNIFGKKISEGDVVLFKYVETLGIDGNILSSNVVTTVEDTIYDIDGDQITMYCKNTDSLDGGNDEEDIEDIRTNGTNAFQAGDKAVAQKDYETRLEKNDLILKSVVWGAYEYNLDNNLDLWTWINTQENVVNVSAFTPAGAQLSDDQKTTVIEDIQQDKPPTDILQFVDVNFIYLIFNVTLYVKSRSYTLSTLKSDVVQGIEDTYSLENLEFATPIYETSWKGYISDFDGVTYHDSYTEIAKFEDLNSAYEGDINLDLYPVKKESIKLYEKNTSVDGDTYTYMGVDNGDGAFIAESPYDLTGSSINYTTGEGVINIVSGISGTYSDYSIKVIYQTKNEDLCPTGRNQFFKLHETNVTAQYIEEGLC